MVGRPIKQKPQMNYEGLVRAREREERLSDALRKNLKRRRKQNPSITLKSKSTKV